MIFVLVLMALLPGAGADSIQAEHKIPAVWLAEPIATADPERRHAVRFKVPTKLLIEFNEDGTHVGFDSTSAATITVKVGRRMAVGLNSELYYFDGTQRVELRRGCTSWPEAVFADGRDVIQGLDEVLASQTSVQLIAELVIFETDIPPQHHWTPKDGRYRELWKGFATGVLR